MDCHISKDSTRDCDVSLWCRTWIAACNDNLFNLANFTFFNASLNCLELWILSAIKADCDIGLCRVGSVAK